MRSRFPCFASDRAERNCGGRTWSTAHDISGMLDSINDAFRRRRSGAEAIAHLVADLPARRRQSARLLHQAGAHLRRRQHLSHGGGTTVPRQRAAPDSRRPRDPSPQLHEEPRSRAQQAPARTGSADERRRDAPAAAAADAAGLSPRSHRRLRAIDGRLCRSDAPRLGATAPRSTSRRR